MSYLIANARAIAFSSSQGVSRRLDIVSVDLVSGEAIVIAQGMEPEFDSCYRALIASYDAVGLSAERFSAPLPVLARQLAQHRDNLYGFSRLEEGGAEWAPFFARAYSFCFAMELTTIFRQLMEEDSLFDSGLAETNENADLEDDLEDLRVLVGQWRMANKIG